MSPNLTTRTYLFLHLYNFSSWSWRVASDSLDDTWDTSFNTRIMFLRSNLRLNQLGTHAGHS